MTSHNLSAVQAITAQLPLDKAALTYGVPLDDLQLLMSPEPWHTPAYRLRIKHAIESIALGSLDSMGLPRVELPAELIAQWIATLVASTNWLPACAFFGRPRTIDQMIEQDDQQLPGITPHRVHAMVIRIATADTDLRHQLRQQCLAAIGMAPELPEQNEITS